MPFYVVLNKSSEGKDSLIQQEIFNVSQAFILDLITNSSLYFSSMGLPELALKPEQIIAPCFVKTNISVNQVNTFRNTGSYQFILNQTSPHPEDLSTFAIMIISNIPMTGEHSELFIPWLRERYGAFNDDFNELGI